MNILFCSYPFHPSLGGIETVSALLVEQFERRGHAVTVVTQTAAHGIDAAADAGAVRVVRRPTALQLLALVQWSDLVFHNNISLRFAWPLLVLRRPWVVAHHTWIARTGIIGRLKRRLLRYATHMAPSRALADALPVPCAIVPNPYADDLFRPVDSLPRSAELVFVGRLVSDKGVELLLDALSRLAQRGRRVRLTVIGDGPEGPALREQGASLGLGTQVEFAGRLVGPALVAALSTHQVLVVPSVWEEPFGVVALEAMACGCVPLVARSGGLPDAVGAAGLVVARGDPEALAQGIEALLGDPALRDRYRAEAPSHLARHTRERVARDYLRLIDDAHGSHPAKSAARAA